MANTSVIVIPEGKICDYVDGKFRNDTPEEYVRQTIEKRLVNEHKYLPKQIRIEYTLQLGSRKPRADIVIFDKDCGEQTQENIKIIIECKKEAVEARNAKDGVEQLKSYMSACPNCEWGMWTNGRQKEVYHKYVNDKGQIDFMDYNDIPSADGNLDDINRPKRTTLKNAYDDNLLFTFKTCHNHIYVNDGLQKQPAFFELLKVIFCKIEDERNITKPLEFYATSEERSNPDGQLTVKKRISKIFEQVKNKKKYRLIFDANDEIKLSPRSLAYIVSELQKYSLLNTNIDIKGKAYEEIVGANLRGDRGEFFTPRNVMKMVVEMINPGADEKVLDSSCGTGGFLVIAMTHVIEKLEKQFEAELGMPKNEWSPEAINTFRDRISEMAKSNYFGFDINPDLVKATKMNMVMNNDGSGNILQSNSLLPPHEWTDDFRSNLAEALGIDKASIRNYKTIEFFNVIVTNPPFGSKIPIKDKAILEQFELAHVWENDTVGFIGSSEMLDVSPQPVKFMIDDDRVSELHVKRGTVLISRSGTIGNMSFVNETLEKFLISEHAMRLECNNFPGYVYAYLKTKTGQALIRSNIYGSVIQQIEPEHLASIPIPNAPNEIKAKIDSMIVESYALRDESNHLINEATNLLIDELQLPAINEFDVDYFKKDAPVKTFSVKLSDMDYRLDASYHVPIVDAIIDHLNKHAEEVITVDDNRISKNIILPGRFKRVYVGEGEGRVFIGGKQLHELDPSNKKYLSLSQHGERIEKQLELHENMTLITCSGTIGKVALVGRHWEKWAANQHIIRIVPASENIAGYLNIFLASEYGYHLITRYTYGAVIDEIDATHVSNIPIPLLKNHDIQKRINDLALEANQKRYEAYKLEQKALEIMDREVIYAK